MTYQQKQATLQPMETDVEPSPLPFQEHCTTALPFITVPDEDSAYALHRTVIQRCFRRVLRILMERESLKSRYLKA